jgi:hypothetical protein
MTKISKLAFIISFVLGLLATFGKFYGRVFLRQPSRVPQAEYVVGVDPARDILVAISASSSSKPPPT